MSETAIDRLAASARSFLRLVSSIRFDEVLVLQGTPILGALYAVSAFTTENAVKAAILVFGSVLLVAHVFCLNDWAGIHGDVKDPGRTEQTFIAKGVSRSAIGFLAVALLAASLLLFGFLGRVTFTVGLSIAFLGALYSGPVSHMKGRPVFGTMLHFAGAILHFILGYTAFAPIDMKCLALGSFFGLAFAAGHLSHETRGWEGDSLNGIRTNAVMFGQKRTFLASLALFTAAYALLTILAAYNVVPRVLLLAGVLYPIQLFASWRALREGLNAERLHQVQRAYRALYAVIGIMMIAALLRQSL